MYPGVCEVVHAYGYAHACLHTGVHVHAFIWVCTCMLAYGCACACKLEDSLGYHFPSIIYLVFLRQDLPSRLG